MGMKNATPQSLVFFFLLVINITTIASAYTLGGGPSAFRKVPSSSSSGARQKYETNDIIQAKKFDRTKIQSLDNTNNLDSSTQSDGSTTGFQYAKARRPADSASMDDTLNSSE